MCQMGCTDASLKGTVDTVVFTVQGFYPLKDSLGGKVQKKNAQVLLNVYIVGSSTTVNLQNDSFALEMDSRLASDLF